MIYVDAEWQHGMMCTNCPHVMHDGDEYHSVPHAMIGDVPICMIVCDDCFQSGSWASEVAA